MAKKTETQLTDMARDWYSSVVESPGCVEWRHNAMKARGFYDGTGQWTESVRQFLESQKRPVLTINRILPVINVIVGHQIKNRREFRLYPRKRGTKAVADLGSSLIKETMETCNGYDAVTDFYRDGLVCGKGWITLDRVYDRDPVYGDIDVSAADPVYMFEDPRNMDYDVNAGEFMFRERLLCKSKLEAYYPDKYEEALDAMGGDWTEDWDTQVAGDDYADEIRSFARALNKAAGQSGWKGGGDTLDGVVIRECWYKTYERITIATAMRGGGMITARITDKAGRDRLRALKSANPGKIEERDIVVRVLNLLVMVGDLVLKHEVDPLNGMTSFPYVRYCPYWQHGKPFGVVDNLVGPQEEHNKARSQILHEINQTANSGWIGGAMTPMGKQQMKNFGAAPGQYFNIEDFGGKLQKVQPNQMSVGHANLAAQSAVDLREISGANPDIQGTQAEQNESGRARLIRQEAGLTTLAPLLSNLNRSEATFGTALWDYMRHNDVYSPEEIEAIVDEDVLNDIGGMRGAVEAMNRWDVGSYGVKAEAAPATRTFREAQRQDVTDLATALRELGVQVAPEVANELLQNIIKLSDFPGRDKILDRMKASPVTTEQPEGAAPAAAPQPVGV